nr:MAG TPA: hypothetical protein [Caudoviricetes sp.]
MKTLYIKGFRSCIFSLKFHFSFTLFSIYDIYVHKNAILSL